MRASACRRWSWAGRSRKACLPAVWHDEKAAVVELVRYLAALGHTRVARVAGVPGFVHSTVRTAVFEEATRELGLSAQVVSTDYTPESGARATRQLLSDPEPPTAIAYDSDVLAVTGLGVAQQMGFSVPDDVSIVAWDDSLLCQVVHPPLTTVSRDISDVRRAGLQASPGAIDDPDDRRARRDAARRAHAAREHRPGADRRGGARRASADPERGERRARSAP